MEICARKLRGMQHLATLNGLECIADMDVRGRQWSGVNKNVCQEQVICPEPRRMAIAPCLAKETYKLCCRSQSHSALHTEGEASYEILDIFMGRGLYGDQVNGYSSLPYFCGSPPSRSDNPLVHDVQFIRKGLPSPAVNVSQKSSCGASFGAKPLVRVEGFSCSSSETHCIVPALA